MGVPRCFRYHFAFDDGRQFDFEVDTDAPAMASENAPDWTLLERQQCPNCPLNKDTTPRCPAAVAIAEVVETFSETSSIDRVQVRVVSAQRTVQKTTDVQTALRSLIGLIMPTSGCPVLGRLHGLARYHLPFSDHEETVFRVVGAYFVEQYLAEQDGVEADWDLDGIRELYRELQVVDTAFVERMRLASPGDASLNAVVALFSLAALVSMSLDDDMKRVRDRLRGPRKP